MVVMTTTKKTAAALTASLAVLAAAVPFASDAATSPAAKARTVAVRISGGHVTDPRDHGRPVVLVAAGLGVPTEVFRTAFSGVTPAGAGEEPDPGQVDENKRALLKVLAPYGVTNERLDQVSNYYRYNGSAGETWRHVDATGRAVIRNGKVVSVTITRAGAGYSSAPAVTVPGHPGAKIAATVSYGRDLATNGGLATLKVVRGG